MRPGQIIGPILLIVAGMVFLVDNLMFDISFGWLISRFWPVALMVIGALQLARAGSGDPARRWGHLSGGAVTATLGVLFQLQRLGVARFGDTWPALLILVGGLGLLRALAAPGFPADRVRGGYSK
jgi:hypothetical protein